MQWFRVYHHISTDPKLHKAARMAKVARATMVGAFITVLDFASQQGERGSILGLDLETFAFLTGCKPCVAAAMLTAMQNVGLVREGQVTNWAKYQRDSDNVAARVKAHRERKASEDGKNREENGKNRDQPLREAEGNETKTNEGAQTNLLENQETPPAGNVTLLRGVTDVTDQNQNRTESEKESPLTPLAGGKGSEASPSGKRDRYPSWDRLPRQGRSVVCPTEFEALWSAYPLREEDTKLGCYEQFRKQVIQRRVDPESLVTAAESYRKTMGHHERRFGLLRWLREAHYDRESNNRTAQPAKAARVNIAEVNIEDLYDVSRQPTHRHAEGWA